MTDLKLNVLCKACYTAYIEVPDELVNKQDKQGLIDYINDNLCDLEPDDGLDWVSDIEFTKEDFNNNFIEVL